MKTINRFISVILALVMIMSLFTFAVSAQSNEPEDNTNILSDEITQIKSDVSDYFDETVEQIENQEIVKNSGEAAGEFLTALLFPVFFPLIGIAIAPPAGIVLLPITALMGIVGSVMLFVSALENNV